MGKMEHKDNGPFLSDLISKTRPFVGQITAYLAAITVLLVALLKFRDKFALLGTYAYLAAFAPLVLVFVTHQFPLWLRRWRRRRLIDIAIQSKRKRQTRSGYFRISPYERIDRDQYRRPDGADEEIKTWLYNTDLPVLYLTGMSGTGKSSLLNASVLPGLEEDKLKPVQSVVVRSFDDPIESLRCGLLAPNVIWEEPPESLEDKDIRVILGAAAEALGKDTRLLVNFDQFEELLIIHERSPDRIRPLQKLLGSLSTNPITNLTILLVIRSDYVVMLQSFLRASGLPQMRQDHTWQEVGPMLERHARTFLKESNLQLGATLTNKVFDQISEIEQSRGQVRPITLNMVGLVLDRTAVDTQARRLSRFSANGLITGYLQDWIGRRDVVEHAPVILRSMISSAATKQPRSVSELSEATHFDGDLVRGCLLVLSQGGLVRPIGQAEHEIWEISHDFVAKLLDRVLASAKRRMLNLIRRFGLPATLLLWVAFFPLANMLEPDPWYTQFTADNVNTRLPNGNYPLHKAVNSGNAPEAVRYLLNLGAATERRGLYRKTPLHLAAELGKHEVVRILVEQGDADVYSTTYSDYNTLTVATNAGQTNVIDYLVNDVGMSLTDTVGDGMQPIHIAASAGQFEAFRYYEQQGIDPLVPFGSAGDIDFLDYRQPMIELAVRGGSIELVRYLVEEKHASLKDEDGESIANIGEALISGDSQVAIYLLEKGVAVESYDLELAIGNGGSRAIAGVIRHYLQKIYEVTGTNHLAGLWERASSKEGLKELEERLQEFTQFFQERGFVFPDLFSDFSGTVEPGRALRVLDDIVLTLLKQETCDTWPGDLLNAMLLIGAAGNFPKTVQYVVDLGANPNGSFDPPEAWREILEEEGDSMVIDLMQWTPLLTATERGSAQSVECLLKNKADPNRSANGRTPLLVAVENENTDIAKILLKHGADPHDRPTSDAQTPMELAQEMDNSELIQLLGGN